MTRWYQDAPFLNGFQFAIANGFPLDAVLEDLAMPEQSRNRMQQCLIEGGSLQQALAAAGLPEKEAWLLAMSGQMDEGRDYAQQSIGRVHSFSRISSSLLQFLVYPNLIVLATLCCWLYFSTAGVASSPGLLAVLSLVVACFAALEILLVLPGWSCRVVPILKKLKLLQEGKILFSFLHLCFRRRMDESAALRFANESLGLRQATGEALDRMSAGDSIFPVLSDMPAVRVLRLSVPRTCDILPALEKMQHAAENQFQESIRRLELLMQFLGLLFSGAVLLLLAVRIVLALYSWELP